MGIDTVLDLLTHYPRRYIDRTREARIQDLAEGEEAMVLASVQRVDSRRTRNGKSMVTVDVTDGSGRLKVTFFNQAWRSASSAPVTRRSSSASSRSSAGRSR